MPNRKEVAGWLREEAVKHRRNVHFAPDRYTKEVENEKANLWEDRAAQVENMRCETCERYVSGEDEESRTFNQIEYHGQGFGCFFHKPKESNK